MPGRGAPTSWGCAIDEFNQSAGRNLGFRKRGEVRHVLLVNRRLFGLLMGGSGVLGPSRYDLRLRLDRNQRYEIRRESPAKRRGEPLGQVPAEKPLHRSYSL